MRMSSSAHLEDLTTDIALQSVGLRSQSHNFKLLQKHIICHPMSSNGHFPFGQQYNNIIRLICDFLILLEYLGILISRLFKRLEYK